MNANVNLETHARIVSNESFFPRQADALEKKSFHIDRRKIQLHEPLKTVGEFTVPVKLHKDVTTHLKVLITKEVAE